MGESSSDTEQKMVSDLSALFPDFDSEVIESLLGASDYDYQTTFICLKRFAVHREAEGENGKYVVTDHTASIPTKFRSAEHSGLIVNNMRRESEGDLSRCNHEIRKFRQTQSALQCGISAESDDYEQEADGDGSEQIMVNGVGVRVQFSVDDEGADGCASEEEHSDSSKPGSPREGECEEEKFTVRKAAVAKGRLDIPAEHRNLTGSAKTPPKKSVAKPSGKKSSCPALLPSIHCGAYRNSFVVRADQDAAPQANSKSPIEMPRLNLNRPPANTGSPHGGSQANMIVVEQLFASRDGIRGHLAASQQASSRQNSARHATPAAASPATRLHFVNMNLPARYNRDQKLQVASGNTRPTSTNGASKAMVPKASSKVPKASTQRQIGTSAKDGKAAAITAKAKSMQPASRSFVKQTAQHKHANAEPKSRSDNKAARQVSKVLEQYEREEMQQEEQLTQVKEIRLPSAKSTSRSVRQSHAESESESEQDSESEQTLRNFPEQDDHADSNGTRANQTAEVDLGELVWKAVRRGSSAMNSDSKRSERSEETRQSTERPEVVAIATRNVHGYELADTGSPIKYKRGKLLGKGAFGRVYLAFTDKGQLIAVKEIEISVPLDPNALYNRQVHVETDELQFQELAQQRFDKEYRVVEREIDILRTIHHPNVVQFLAVYCDYGALGDNSCKVYIFTEYISGDTVANLLRQFGTFSEPITRHYVAQIVSGMVFLHSHNVIHRDLKGQNIMVDKLGNVKLIDFGSAKTLVQQATADSTVDSSRQSTLKFEDRWDPQNGMTADATNKHNSVIGSPYWMAPEVIRQDGYSFKSDCWSLGCTVFEMATGYPPWHGPNPLAALWHIASDSEIPSLLQQAPDFSIEADDFVKHCLQRNVNARYSSKRLQQCAFIAEGASA